MIANHYRTLNPLTSVQHYYSGRSRLIYYNPCLKHILDIISSKLSGFTSKDTNAAGWFSCQPMSAVSLLPP